MSITEQQDTTDLYKLIIVLLILIVVAFIAGYLRGKEDKQTEIEYRTLKEQSSAQKENLKTNL